MHLSQDPIRALWPSVRFTKTEQALLSYLLLARGQVVARETLLREVWGYLPTTRTNTVSTTIQRLRAKIEPDPKRPTWILSLRGRGYRLAVPLALGSSIPPRSDRIGGSPISLHPPATRSDSNIVEEGTRFVGRAKDLEQLDRLFGDGARMVTLHGGSGMGKTRLACRFGIEQRRKYRGGVWLCDVSNAQTALDALSIIAQVLGAVQTQKSLDGLFSQLAALLQPRGPTLLIVDNFEQLESQAAVLIERLQREAQQTAILITSRSRLGVADEVVQPLAPLPTKQGQQLFRSRILSAGGEDPNPQFLSDITEQLEGVPLAIEMAAARARIVPLSSLGTRLRHSFSILRLDRHGAPARHQTIEKAIGWSWQLLSESQRSAVIQLCVFRGGCSLEAAESILRVDTDVLTALASLLDASMLRRWTVGPDTRFGLYNSVRSFALETHAPALEAARRRHATWCLDYARHWAQSYNHHPESGPALLSEINNLVEAYRYFLQMRSPEAADMAAALSPLVRERGIPSDWEQMLHAAGELSACTDEQVANLLILLADRRKNQGDSAIALLERAFRLLRPDSKLYVRLLGQSAWHKINSGQAEASLAELQQAIALTQKLNCTEELPWLHNKVGTALVELVRYDDAIAAFRRGIAVAPEARPAASLWNNLGSALETRGDTVAGREAIDRALQIGTRFNDLSAIHTIHSNLAVSYARRGEFFKAHHLYSQLLANDERLGRRSGVGARLVNAGIVAVLVEDYPVALKRLKLAAEQLDRAGHVGTIVVICQTYLLICYATMDDEEHAVHYAARLEALCGPDTPARAAHAADISLGHLDLLRSREAYKSGDLDGFRQHREQARRRLEDGKPSGHADEEMIVQLLRNAYERTP